MKLATAIHSARRRWSGRRRIALATIAVVILSAAVAIPVLARNDDAGINRQLAPVRQATSRYHDVNLALADGYEPIPINGELCVTHTSHGAMGIHYLKANLVDQPLDPLTPELLLYEPRGGKLQLVGVEYFTVDVGQPVPSLFGRQFDGPNSSLEGIPTHYSLHVWLWKANPSGMFAPHNPNVRC